MTEEMFWLALSIGLLLVIWIPYTVLYGGLNNLKVGTVIVPPTERLPGWAQRCHRVHMNLIESLMPFAILILMLKVMGKTDGATATAAAIFFFARVVHAVVYIAAIPYLRPAAFSVSWFVNLYLLWKVLA